VSLQQSPTASVNPIKLSKKKSPLANPMDVIIISRNSQFVYPINKMAIADKSSHKHVIRRLLGFNNFEVLKSHAASLKLQSMESFDIFKIATIIWRYFKVWCSKQIWFFCNYSTIYVHKFFGVLKYWKNDSASGCTLVWEHSTQYKSLINHRLQIQRWFFLVWQNMKWQKDFKMWTFSGD
jgi:hypothetical protein